MSETTTTKPMTDKTVTKKYMPVLAAVRERKTATAKDLGITPVLAARLLAAEVFDRKDDVKTGKRGRPAHSYGLTRKWNDRTRRWEKKRQEQAEAAVSLVKS